MDGFDLGKAAEWARKVAQKLEKNGRLLLMAGMFRPSGHVCSLAGFRGLVELCENVIVSRPAAMESGACPSAKWIVGDVDRHDCAPVVSCVDDNVCCAARRTVAEIKFDVLPGARSVMYERRITTKCGQKRISMRGTTPDFLGFRLR